MDQILTKLLLNPNKEIMQNICIDPEPCSQKIITLRHPKYYYKIAYKNFYSITIF